MDSLFVLNHTGTFLVEKHYGVRTPRDACGPLLQRLIAAGGVDGGSDGRAGESSGGARGGPKSVRLLPRVMRGARGTILLHVNHNNLLFVGVTHREVSTPATDVLSRYIYFHMVILPGQICRCTRLRIHMGVAEET